MLTGADQQFLVQLTGYALGFGGAVVCVLYLAYRLFKSVEDALSFIGKLLFKKTKSV